MAISVALTIREWFFQITGFWGRSLASLPAATMEPVKVTKPITRASTATYLEKLSRAWITERMATSAEEIPPRPFRKATTWGIWIILTLAAQIRLRTAPTAMAIQITGASRMAF